MNETEDALELEVTGHVRVVGTLENVQLLKLSHLRTLLANHGLQIVPSTVGAPEEGKTGSSEPTAAEVLRRFDVVQLLKLVAIRAVQDDNINGLAITTVFPALNKEVVSSFRMSKVKKKKARS